MISRKEIYALIFFVSLMILGANSESLLASIMWHIGTIGILLFSTYKYLLEVEKEEKK